MLWIIATRWTPFVHGVHHVRVTTLHTYSGCSIPGGLTFVPSLMWCSSSASYTPARELSLNPTFVGAALRLHSCIS